MQELDELFIRNKIRQILNENLGIQGDYGWGDIMPPSGEAFYNTFIGPFVDVVKVANVAVKDIASATLTNLQMAITFDNDKQQDLLNKFRQDRQKYKGEMDKAMATTNQALSSPDAQLLMFMANPGVYMGAGMTKAALNTAEPLTDFVGDNLGAIGKGLGLGSDWKPEKREVGPLAGIMGDLKALFFGRPIESVDPILELEKMILKEGDEEKEEKKQDVNEEEVGGMIDDWLEETGAGEKIEGYMRNVIDQKRAEVEAVKQERMATIEALGNLTKATSFEELKAVQPQLQEVGIDLTAELAEVEKTAQEQKDVVKAGGTEAEKLLDGLKTTPDGKNIADDASPEQWYPLVDQTIIAGAFADAVDTFKKQSVGDLLGFVAEMPRDELEQLSETGPLGKEFADIIFGLENDLLSM